MPQGGRGEAFAGAPRARRSCRGLPLARVGNGCREDCNEPQDRRRGRTAEASFPRAAVEAAATASRRRRSTRSMKGDIDVSAPRHRRAHRLRRPDPLGRRARRGPVRARAHGRRTRLLAGRRQLRVRPHQRLLPADPHGLRPRLRRARHAHRDPAPRAHALRPVLGDDGGPLRPQEDPRPRHGRLGPVDGARGLRAQLHRARGALRDLRDRHRRLGADPQRPAAGHLREVGAREGLRARARDRRRRRHRHGPGDRHVRREPRRLALRHVGHGRRLDPLGHPDPAVGAEHPRRLLLAHQHGPRFRHLLLQRRAEAVPDPDHRAHGRDDPLRDLGGRAPVLLDLPRRRAPLLGARVDGHHGRASGRRGGSCSCRSTS